MGDVDAGLEKRAGDFLEGKETMPLAAVIDERGLEAGFDAGDDTLVDIAFALLFAGGFDVEIDQFLTVDNSDAQLFGLRRVEQHAFHFWLSRAQSDTGRAQLRTPA